MLEDRLFFDLGPAIPAPTEPGVEGSAAAPAGGAPNVFAGRWPDLAGALAGLREAAEPCSIFDAEGRFPGWALLPVDASLDMEPGVVEIEAE